MKLYYVQGSSLYSDYTFMCIFVTYEDAMKFVDTYEEHFGNGEDKINYDGWTAYLDIGTIELNSFAKTQEKLKLVKRYPIDEEDSYSGYLHADIDD